MCRYQPQGDKVPGLLRGEEVPLKLSRIAADLRCLGEEVQHGTNIEIKVKRKVALLFMRN